MNYVMYYDFDNFDSIYECIPSVLHLVCLIASLSFIR